jgi:hypothetical protein
MTPDNRATPKSDSNQHDYQTKVPVDLEMICPKKPEAYAPGFYSTKELMTTDTLRRTRGHSNKSKASLVAEWNYAFPDIAWNGLYSAELLTHLQGTPLASVEKVTYWEPTRGRVEMENTGGYGYMSPTSHRRFEETSFMLDVLLDHALSRLPGLRPSPCSPFFYGRDETVYLVFESRYEHMSIVLPLHAIAPRLTGKSTHPVKQLFLDEILIPSLLEMLVDANGERMLLAEIDRLEELTTGR